jgi:hypothetical protein
LGLTDSGFQIPAVSFMEQARIIYEEHKFRGLKAEIFLSARLRNVK